MAYQEVAGTKKYFKYRECEAGDVLVEGIYLRDVHGKYGIQYEFEDKSGDVHVLSGSGQLKYKMEFIKEGDKVKIIYVGEVPLTKGIMAGKTAHQFAVFRDVSDDDGLDSLDDDDALADDDDDGLDEFEEL